MIDLTNLVPIAVSISAIGVLLGGLLWIVNLIIKAELKTFETKYTQDFSDFKARYTEDFSNFKAEYLKTFAELELKLTKLISEK